MDEIVKKVRELHELVKGSKYHIRICSKFLQVTVGDNGKRKKAIEVFKNQIELCNYQDEYGGNIQNNISYLKLIETIEGK